MKYLAIVLLTVLVYSCGSGGGQGSPKALFEKAHQAVLDKDIDALTECITVGNGLTAEMARAYAELIIYVKSGDYQNMRDTYESRLNATKTHPIDQIMLQAFGVNFMPDFDKAAATGEYDQESQIMVVPSVDQPLKYRLDEKEGNWTFWVSAGKPNAYVIEGVGLLRGMEAALAKNTEEETKEALDALIQTFVKPTELTYANTPLAGKMSGVDWAMFAGKAEQSFRGGKGRISVTLVDTKLNDDCRVFMRGSKVLLSFERPGAYDFRQTGHNLTLVYDPGNSNKLVQEGKIDIQIDQEKRVVSGRITAKLDDDNFVSGTFEVPFCGDIVLD